MPRPLVSVVIPTYNHARYVCASVESALAQSYDNLEIIVIDDGSTDNTPEVLHPYMERVCYVHQANQGLAAARNTGLRHATGAFVQFLDADDLLDCEKIARQVRAMEAHPDVGVAYGDAKYFYGEDVARLVALPEYTGPRPNTYEAFFWKNILPVNAALVRTSSLPARDPFDPELRNLEDWHLWLRMALGGTRFLYVPDACCRVRLHGSNMSCDRLAMSQGHVTILRKISHAYRGQLPAKVYGQIRRSLAAARYDRGRILMAYGHKFEGLAEMFRGLLPWPGHKGNRPAEVTLAVAICLMPGIEKVWPKAARFLEEYRYRNSAYDSQAENAALPGNRPEADPQARDVPAPPTAEEAHQRPLVSVVVCAYNAEGFIEQTLEAILAQDYRPLEVVVIDDGSTDGTGTQVQRLATEHPEIRYFHQVNRGRHEAANEGIRRASGKYIAVNDHDDLPLPDRIRLEVEFLESHPDYALVGGWAEVVNGSGQRCTTWEVPCDWETIRASALKRNCFLHSSVMYRRDAALEVGCYRQEFDVAGDADFLKRLIERHKAANLPRVLYKYYITANCATVKRAQEACFYGRMARQYCRERAETGSDRLQRGEPFLTPVETAELQRIRESRTLRSIGYHNWAEIFRENGLRRSAAGMAVRAVWIAPLKLANWRQLALALMGKRLHRGLQNVKRRLEDMNG